MSSEALKLSLIARIMDLDDISFLQKLDTIVNEMNSSSNDALLAALAKPIRKKLDLEELKKEQNYSPMDKEVLFKKMDELGIEEPIEELIAMI